jgi:RimJ/RimL family protein N-acetyltransferase
VTPADHQAAHGQPAHGQPAHRSPVQVGRYTRVRPVTPDDYGWLFDLAVATPAGSRWRLHGELPTFDAFVTGLLRGATATCAVEALDGGPIGMVQLWQHDLLSRHAQLTAFVDPAVEGRGWPLEGVVLFVDYAFAAFDLRKLYLETLATELPAFASLVGTVLREEGCLRAHRYVFGQHVDCHLLALYREDFEREAAALLPVTSAAGR